MKLLREARDKSQAKKYMHKGYTINRQVCARKTDTSDVICTTSMADLSKIHSG